MDTKGRIIELLESVERGGMDQMVNYLEAGGFFTSPASTRFHGSYEGGLAEHSLGVYKLLDKHSVLCKCGVATNPGATTLPVTDNNIIVAALLHDVCKIGAYITVPDEGGGFKYRYNRTQPKGHAMSSLIRIVLHIKLEPIEEMMIKFHMGPYGCFEFEPGKGEYPLRSERPGGVTHKLSKEDRYGKSLMNAWYHNPIVKLMYFCDELEILT